MNIKEEAAKLCKKLMWQLESGIPLSAKKKESKEEEIKDLTKQLLLNQNLQIWVWQRSTSNSM